MRKKLYFIIFFLLLSNEFVLGKNGNNKKVNHNKSNKAIEKNTSGRDKRSLIKIIDKGDTKVFGDDVLIPNTAQEFEDENEFAKHALNKIQEINAADRKYVNTPFWGNRGRRDGSSESVEYFISADERYKDHICKSCATTFRDYQPQEMINEIMPFWSNRGKKDSDESIEYTPLWGNKDRRQDDNDPPFWGNRGKKHSVKIPPHENIEYPFWSSRGRRDEMEPFWGNRGRRDEVEPFWGNRGRRDEMEPFWGNRGRRDEIKPFLGSSGQQYDDEPFWGTRGRRESETPIWGNHNNVNEYKSYWTASDSNPFWGIRGRRKFALKQNIINAMNNIEYDIEKLARIRRDNQNSFWSNRGRDSKLKYLFNDPLRSRIPESQIAESKSIPTRNNFRPSEQKTVHDDKMYAEEPHYILIERNSRSSAEDDPFFISRGKKYTNFKLPKNVRGRRGAIEELVKSVRNDPYYIARGKKDSEHIKIFNSTIPRDEFMKAKELICSAIDMLGTKSNELKVKRDVDDSERERRTILKKLAAELQIDPYFVSRGKKNGETDANEDRVEQFVNHVSDMCN